MPALPPSAIADGSVASMPPGLGTGRSLGTESLDPPRPPGSEETERTDSEDMSIVDEVINDFLAANPSDGVTGTSYDQRSADSTLRVQQGPAVHDTLSSDANSAPDIPTKRKLRKHTQISYREPSGVRGGTSKPGQAQFGYINAPKIPPRCCPAEVPPALLSSLSNPLVFAEVVDQFSPYLEQLCRSHLQLFAERTSAIAFTQQRDDQTWNNGTSMALWASPLGAVRARPPRRRTASLPDIRDEPSSKRQRLDGPYQFPHGLIAGHSPIHDLMIDDTYRQRVLAKLEERLRHTSTLDTHGRETDKLMFNILQKAEPPITDKNDGMVDAIFSTGSRAASQVESGSPNVPIFTEGQQQFQWSGRDRPIAELFRRMEDLDRTVSVQIPSRRSTTKSFESRKLSQVRHRFLANMDTDDPWNLLDLRSPLPPSTLPSFLTGENCQLLLRIRDAVLNGDSAERAVASREEWNEWRDVL